MRCIKCGVVRTSNNFKNKSCRVHTSSIIHQCSCGGDGNCYHEWSYLWFFWMSVRILKNFIKKKYEIPLNNSQEDYVIL